MVQAFDVSKYRKSLTKSINGISVGFNDPSVWISTGNKCLNFLISGDFERGVPLGKFSIFAGESGAGKSLIVSGNIIRNAQKQGIFVVLMDTENALDSDWLTALGVDIDDDKLLRISVSMIDDVAKTISDFVKQYKIDFSDLPKDERPKVLFVIDSLGMLMTPTDLDQFEKGDLKGDMGRKPKALGALVRNCMNIVGQHNIGIVATNHVYASADMFDPEPKISGGNLPIFSASIVVAMRKLKLKEDEEGNKSSSVAGIRAVAKVVKTRFCKPFEQVTIKIPYSKGMDEHSGLFDLFQNEGLVTKTGNKYIYQAKDGTEHKYFAKEYERNHNGILDLIIDEFDYKKAEKPADQEEDLDEGEFLDDNG